MPTPQVIHDSIERIVYVTPVPTEAVTTPEPSPTPEPELTVAAVVKTWDDMNDLDGSRPASLTVTLLANGKAVDTAVLNEGNGWRVEITDLPATEDGAPISYTWSEESVPGYTATVSIVGNTTMLTNRHVPELTQVSVRKVWDDNDNAAHMRPTSITATLSNGTVVILNEANGWSATVENLPKTIDGQPITYTWREQEVIGYTQTDMSVNGDVTTFTNKYRERPTPPDDRPVPGTPTIEIPDYDTPLGIEVIINHVGDCFD
jgi:nitrogen fixation protein